MAPSLSELDQYAKNPFADDYPHDRRTFFAGQDDVHGVILHMLGWVTTSLDLAMYGFDDDQAADRIHDLMADPHVHVRLVLDKSQAGGVHERLILAREQYANNLVAIGNSRHGAIVHLKSGVIDGRWWFGGSTNWSASGEGLQENHLTVVDNRAEAHALSTQISAIYTHITGAPAGGGV